MSSHKNKFSRNFSGVIKGQWRFLSILLIGVLSPTIMAIETIPSIHCQNKETRQLGVCIFALDCVKVSGKHVGLCMDQFYFKSCCQIENSTGVFIPSNNSVINSNNSDPMTSVKLSTVLAEILKLNFTEIISHNLTTTTQNDSKLEPTQNSNSTISSDIIDSVQGQRPQVNMSHLENITRDNFQFFKSNLTLLNDHEQICGRTFLRSGRIVGGTKSQFGRWPWQISLRRRSVFSSQYNHRCGAVLLSSNFALTAAHCVAGTAPENLLLRLGEFDMEGDKKKSEYSHIDRGVKVVITHSLFDPKSFEYDVALIKLNESVQFQPNIIPICIPHEKLNLTNQSTHVIGWGRLRHDGPISSKLHEISLPIIANKECEAMFRRAGHDESLPEIFLCAGHAAGGRDACDGDSGGPMVIQRESDGRWILVGVTSWGINCAKPNQPGVYIRISVVKNWITKMLQF